MLKAVVICLAGFLMALFSISMGWNGAVKGRMRSRRGPMHPLAARFFGLLLLMAGLSMLIIVWSVVTVVTL